MTDRKPFQLPENRVSLELDGPWQGAVIDVNLSISWPVYEAVERWLADFRDLADDDLNTERVGAALRSVAEIFAEHALRGWNLTDRRGDPIPETADGLMSLNSPTMLASVVGGWLGAVGTVPDPLPIGSPGGTDATPSPDSPTES